MKFDQLPKNALIASAADFAWRHTEYEPSGANAALVRLIPFWLENREGRAVFTADDVIADLVGQGVLLEPAKEVGFLITNDPMFNK
jgi:hypothetical protein